MKSKKRGLLVDDVDRAILETLFKAVHSRTVLPERPRGLLYCKWQAYTFQYEWGFGVVGQKSRLTVWHYNHVVIEVTRMCLSANDKERFYGSVLSSPSTSWNMQMLLEAVECDKLMSVGKWELLYRITLGGIIARRAAQSPPDGS